MSEQVFSSIIRVKQPDGTFIAMMPINTTEEVYFDIDNGLTLKKYLDSKYIEVENDTARFNLGNDKVTVGSIIKVTETEKFYMVTDITKLNSELGYTFIYTNNYNNDGGDGAVTITSYTSDDII